MTDAMAGKKRIKELRIALKEMISAARTVTASWCEGDLAGAVNLLEETADECEELL